MVSSSRPYVTELCNKMQDNASKNIFWSSVKSEEGFNGSQLLIDLSIRKQNPDTSKDSLDDSLTSLNQSDSQNSSASESDVSRCPETQIDLTKRLDHLTFGVDRLLSRSSHFEPERIARESRESPGPGAESSNDLGSSGLSQAILQSSVDSISRPSAFYPFPGAHAMLPPSLHFRSLQAPIFGPQFQSSYLQNFYAQSVLFNMRHASHFPAHFNPHLNQQFFAATGNGGKRKKSWSRAVFSHLQRKGLERRFQHQKYITKPDRKQLAASLGLTDAQVKVWFQNRRMKWRHQEMKQQRERERAAGASTSNQVMLTPNTTDDLGSPTDSPLSSDIESEAGDSELIDLSEQDVKPS